MAILTYNATFRSTQNLIVFNDVIAPHAQTHESLSLSLTFANQDSQGIATLQDETSQSTQKEWYEYLNIIDAFKLGGYETLSISNQEGVSLFGNAAASILKRADRVEFVNVGDSLDLTKHDGALLPILQLYLSPPPTENHFIVLHLMGSHARYESRYPVDFKYFHSENVIAPTFAHKSTLAAYLNSVLYGDFVISEIIKQFEDSDSLVLFLSDHGEEVYDFRDFIGHSDSKISRFMVEIPFIIYVSDTFINKHPMLYERIQQAKDQRYMNDDLIHTLLDIAGISLKGYEPQRSIISLDKSLLDKRMRKVGDKSNTKDYDKELMQIPTPKQENLER